MQLTPLTLSTIKSFSVLNPKLVIHEGNVLRTLSTSRSVWARATIDQGFPKRFAIADLSRFLGVLSLFQNPDLVFEKNQVKILSGNQKIRYTYADEEGIIPCPDEIKFPSVDLTFTLAADVLKTTLKAASAMQMPDIAIIGEEGKFSLQALNAKERNTSLTTLDSYSCEIGDTEKKFAAVFKAEYFHKLIPTGYNVRLSNGGICHLKATGSDLEYYIVMEADLSRM